MTLARFLVFGPSRAQFPPVATNSNAFLVRFTPLVGTAKEFSDSVNLYFYPILLVKLLAFPPVARFLVFAPSQPSFRPLRTNSNAVPVQFTPLVGTAKEFSDSVNLYFYPILLVKLLVNR